VYDTRADATAREYWILHEYFPSRGYRTARPRWEDVVNLAGHIAELHAYTHERLGELSEVLDTSGNGAMLAPEMLVSMVQHALADRRLVSSAGLSSDDQEVLSRCCDAILTRPHWVDEWQMVLVNADLSSRNTAVRDEGQLVSFDWGAAHLGPAEEDFDVLRSRDFAGEPEARDLLVEVYLHAFGVLTGQDIAEDRFLARMPWARLMVTLRYIAGSFASLQWMPWQSRSAFLVHDMVKGLAHNLLHL
jgi:hypothetical protein